METVIVKLTATPPYDFDLTAAAATHFSGQYGAENFQDSVFQRLLNLGGHLCLASVRSVGTIDIPQLELELKAASLDEAIVTEACRQISWILGTDQNLTPFYNMALEEPKLASLIQELWGLHIPLTVSVYEALVSAIVGQQINSHVARMLWNLLIKTFGPSMQVAGVTYNAFPQPEALLAAGMDGLRSVKLSTRKAEYILGITSRVTSEELDLEDLRNHSDEDVIRTLISLRGIGSWTAQWLLIHALGRSDGFPSNDLALQRTLGILLNDGHPLRPEEASEHSRHWSPFRSYVTTYLFAAVRSGRLSTLFPVGQLR